MKNYQRQIDLVVISDVHLGTFGCHAKELNQYLKSIKPKILILNGDIIDFWQYSKWYWPKDHTKVYKNLLKLLGNDTTIYYLTGNHDETLRKFSDTTIGNFHLKNKLVLNLDGHKAWFFHGDVFDISMKQSKWIAKMGAIGYDTLILMNRFVNYIYQKLGRDKISFSKKIKNSVKSAINFIGDFEQTVIDIAKENKYKYVVCGHIHQPVIKDCDGTIYLNCGDWVENLTALEYHSGEWSLYKHTEKLGIVESDNQEIYTPEIHQLLQSIIKDLS